MNSSKQKLFSVLQMFARGIGALGALGIAGFCGFGFLASFEPGNSWLWKAGYGLLGCACLTAAVQLLRRPTVRNLGGYGLLAVALFCVLGLAEVSLCLPEQVGYGVLGCGCLVGAGAIFAPSRRVTQTASR